LVDCIALSYSFEPGVLADFKAHLAFQSIEIKRPKLLSLSET
jgi:hypothetical protein